jgi:hypothetical protein
MWSGLALGRKQAAFHALAGRALGKKRERILQSGKELVHGGCDAAIIGFGQRHVKQADQWRHQQQRALPSCGAGQGMKMQRPHAQKTNAGIVDKHPSEAPARERHTD